MEEYHYLPELLFLEGEQELNWLRDAGYGHLAAKFEGIVYNIVPSLKFRTLLVYYEKVI